MIKDMMELKPTESPLSDFDIIQVEIHRCPKCECQFNIFFFRQSIQLIFMSFLVHTDGRFQSPSNSSHVPLEI